MSLRDVTILLSEIGTLQNTKMHAFQPLKFQNITYWSLNKCHCRTTRYCYLSQFHCRTPRYWYTNQCHGRNHENAVSNINNAEQQITVILTDDNGEYYDTAISNSVIAEHQNNCKNVVTQPNTKIQLFQPLSLHNFTILLSQTISLQYITRPISWPVSIQNAKILLSQIRTM